MADPNVGTNGAVAQVAHSTPAPGQSTPFTPGPWAWFKSYRGDWYLGTPHSGRLIVMDFVRLGMQGAQPRFSDRGGSREGGIMHKAANLDVDNHPDARLMAAAPDLYRALSDLVNELPDVAIDVFREVAGNSNASALRARRSAAIKALARARGEVAQWV